MAMATQKPIITVAAPCLDWILAPGSNIHIARDRSWFGDYYTVFPSALGDGTPVEGIGTVSLPVKRSPSSSGRKAHGILRLVNVLHVPNAKCNILGRPVANEYKFVPDFQDLTKSTIRDAQGLPLAYFRPVSATCQLLALRLSGPPVGPNIRPCILEHVDTLQILAYIKAIWPEAERQRWYSTFSSLASTSVHPATPPAASKSVPGPKTPHTRRGDTCNASAKKPPSIGSSSAPVPSRRGGSAPQPPPQEAEQPQEQNTDIPTIPSAELVDDKLLRVVSSGKETRSCFMFPCLHDAVRAAVSEDIPRLWFNASPDPDEDDDLEDTHNTSIMGEFQCGNKKCPRGRWHSKKIAIWIRGYPSSGFDGGYNAVVFNQRCRSCNEIAKMSLEKDTYVDRVAFRLRKWAGVEVSRPVFVRNPKIRHDSKHCEGCRPGHCELAERDWGYASDFTSS